MVDLLRGLVERTCGNFPKDFGFRTREFSDAQGWLDYGNARKAFGALSRVNKNIGVKTTVGSIVATNRV